MDSTSRPQLAIPPALPRPPGSTPADTRDYLNQLVRMIEGYIRLSAGAPLLRGGGLFLPGLPTSEAGLAPDMVFSNNGVLTLVRLNVANVTGGKITTALGTVTTTP